jgi:nucleoside-diphosphate-sugar epimerase
MKVLLVGGSGFLSSAVASEAQRAGHRVTVFTRGNRPVPEGVSTITGDRKEVDSFVRAFEGRPFDLVIDCICFTPSDAEADLRAFAGRVGHLQMISTDFVYGRYRRWPADEDTPTQALNDYGRNKIAAEETLFAAFREEGFPVTTFRPPHIMGAGGQLGTGSLQGRDPMLLDRFSRGEPVVLLDGGSLLIQPAVHRDIARACLAGAGRESTFGKAYNVAGPDCLTTREYYDIVAATIGVEEPSYLSLPSDLFVRAWPDKEPFALHRMYSTDRLTRDTGYRPDTTVRHAIFEMVDAIGCGEVDGRTVWGEPFVRSEQEARIVSACRAFEVGLQTACLSQ